MLVYCKFIIILNIITHVKSALTPTSSYENSVILVKPDVYYLYWNYTTDEFIAEIHVKTTGWISFGLTSSPQSTKADLIIGWVTSDKNIRFADCYMNDDQVYIDNKQNWFLLGAAETSGYTVLKFKRNILLCSDDQNHDLDIQPGTPYVTYAWGDSDPDRFIIFNNTNRGVQPVPLISTRTKSSKSETSFTIDFSMDTVFLPNGDTESFFCRFFSMSSQWDAIYSSAKRHLTTFTTILQSGNEDYVQDWVMYACPINYRFPNISKNLTCNLLDNNAWTTALNACNKVVLLWTKGNFLIQEFPASLGFPFGGSDFDIDKFILRVHYENPKLDQGVTDNTTVEFTLTSTLRSLEVGTLVAGVNRNYAGLTLPPGASQISIYSYCTTSCINQMTANFSFISVFASVPHTFSRGTDVYTKLIRANKEYANIPRNKFYNSSYQYSIFTTDPVTILQGDSLKTVCTYDTSNEQTYLFGNEDEICQNILFYYPRNSQISYCTSETINSAWISLIKTLNKNSIPIDNVTLTESIAQIILSQITTDDSVRKSFQSLYSTAAQTQYCGFNNTFTNFTQPSITSTLTDTPTCSINGSNKNISFQNFFMIFFLLILFIYQM